MAEIGKYIYGIINSQTEATIDTKTCNGVYTIAYQDIAAVVIDSEIVDYTHMFKEDLAKLLVNHQKVIESFMNVEYTIVPVRLGTFAKDETEVNYILNKGYNFIKDIINRVKNKIEIDTAVTWSDFVLVLKEVGEEKEIKEFKDNLLTTPKGITVDTQIKVGFMVKKVLDEKREKYAFQIQEKLMRICYDFRTHELMDDRMVANFASLINKYEQQDFIRKVEELNTQFREKLNFRCVGPLPPYSFYTLEIKKLQFEDLEWAKKKLNLDNFVDREELKKVYRQITFSVHPDKNSNTLEAGKEFDEVTRAYKTLIDYCKACEQVSQKDRYSFNDEEFKKNAILIKVRD